MTVERFAPLDGITVISVAEQYPGPLTARLLADLGAHVTQIERPVTGDPARDNNPWLARAVNTRRHSVELDLKSPEGQERIRELLQSADVFLEGFRPGVADRLGLGHAALQETWPHLVYCSISGYGQTGPYAQVVGHNLNYEGVSGLLHSYTATDPEEYFRAPLPVGDVVAGSLSALGIVSALRTVEKTGRGSYLDMSIAESMLYAAQPEVTRAVNDESSTGWDQYEAGYGIFRTKDGHVALGISHEEHFWRDLCDVMDLSAEHRALDHGARLIGRGRIRVVLQEVFEERTTAEWITALGPTVPVSQVIDMADAVHDPHFIERGMIVTAVDEDGRTFTTVASPFGRGLGPADLKVERLGESNPV